MPADGAALEKDGGWTTDLHCRADYLLPFVSYVLSQNYLHFVLNIEINFTLNVSLKYVSATSQLFLTNRDIPR